MRWALVTASIMFGAMVSVRLGGQDPLDPFKGLPKEVRDLIPKRNDQDSRFERGSLEDALTSQRTPSGRKLRKVNGVTMEVDVRVVEQNGKPTDFEFSWKLTYSGPRPPLIILEPSLIIPTTSQTSARFYAIMKGEKQGRVTSRGSPASWDIPEGKKWPRTLEEVRKQQSFLTIEKDKPRTGKTSTTVEALKKHLRDEHPKEFAADTPPELWVQFFHQPINRGQIEELDAWTGDLESPILQVPQLKSW